jgi:tartrate/fumarate subfamily iron-sulfur-dependent hydro-lyase alpha chain
MITKQIIIDLYKKASCQLPSDIVTALEKIDNTSVKTMLENVYLAKKSQHPLCQDTGTAIFYVDCPIDEQQSIREAINQASIDATIQIPLRPNSLDPLTGKSNGNIPVIHFSEGKTKISLLMKGGGSENISAFYVLPNESLDAQRNLDGVKKCVLDAVLKAQGRGCPPYIIGVAIGGTLEEAIHLSKKQLLRKIDDINNDLSGLEHDLLTAINSLGIGPMGLGGETTALAVKACKTQHHPASFFVAISFGCWSTRRAEYEA